MKAETDRQKEKEKTRAKRRLLMGACLLVGLAAVLCVGAAVYVVYQNRIVTPEDEFVATETLSTEELRLADLQFSGQLETTSGSTESIQLNLRADRRFEMQTQFGAQSIQPTTRVGRWRIDAERGLHLDVIELDGEPTNQPALFFQVGNDALIGAQYDRMWFDYDRFVLVASGELDPQSGE